MSYYYHMCKRHIGRTVSIRTVDGRVHRGRISRVCATRGVYITPIGRAINSKEDVVRTAQTAKGKSGEPKGEEVFWFGWWIPFATIAALSFLPFFWGPYWW